MKLNLSCALLLQVSSLHILYAFIQSELVESSSIREEVVDLREIKNGFSTEIKTDVIEVEPVAKLDNRFFGELLAEVYRKNSDIHTCISEHVAKIRGR